MAQNIYPYITIVFLIIHFLISIDIQNKIKSTPEEVLIAFNKKMPLPLIEVKHPDNENIPYSISIKDSTCSFTFSLSSFEILSNLNSSILSSGIRIVDGS